MIEEDKKRIMKNKGGFSGHLAAWGRYLLILAIGIYLFSGLYLIKTYEIGVLRLFGRVINAHIGPGLHYRIPYPFTSLDKIKLQERKRISVGFEFSDKVMGRKTYPSLGEFISGDENILNLEMVIQYFIISPVEYLFRVDNPEAIIRSLAKRNVTRIIAQMKVDDILKGEGKVFIQSMVFQDTQSDLDGIIGGKKKWIQITSVNLQNIAPPLEVADAFKDVVAARQDRDRLINEAQGYRYDALPKARGKAVETIQQAEIYRKERVNQAKGEAARFLAMAKEYKQKGRVTLTRLYLETMEHVLGRMQKVFIQDEKNKSAIDLSIVNLDD